MISSRDFTCSSHSMVTVVVTGHSSRRSTPPRWTPTGNGLQRGQFCWPPLGKTVDRQRAATWPPLGRISWPPTAGRHNSRQRLPKPQTVSETPQNKQTPMRRDLIVAPCHPHITSTATIHLGDAPSSGSDTCLDTRIIPHRRGFSANANPLNAKTRERSGLVSRGVAMARQALPVVATEGSIDAVG